MFGRGSQFIHNINFLFAQYAHQTDKIILRNQPKQIKAFSICEAISRGQRRRRRRPQQRRRCRKKIALSIILPQYNLFFSYYISRFCLSPRLYFERRRGLRLFTHFAHWTLPIEISSYSFVIFDVNFNRNKYNVYLLNLSSAVNRIFEFDFGAEYFFFVVCVSYRRSTPELSGIYA